MTLSTDRLTLNTDTPIDLQVHTHFSDGTWTPDALLDHLVREGFGLVAITDHDRVDTAPALQVLAREKGLPVLVAVEMTTTWRGDMTDVLCFGFDLQKSALKELALDVARRQRENTSMIFEAIRPQGYTFSEADINAVLETPSAQQPHELVALFGRYGYGTGQPSAGRIITDAGFAFMTTPIDAVVDAAHRDGGVCLIAHPGRGGEFTQFDAALLDALRAEVPIDGIEAYYPRHAPEQVKMFLEYAARHDLLVSSGSDSHGSDKPPIPYRAELSRKLLERLGIQVT